MRGGANASGALTRLADEVAAGGSELEAETLLNLGGQSSGELALKDLVVADAVGQRVELTELDTVVVLPSETTLVGGLQVDKAGFDGSDVEATAVDGLALPVQTRLELTALASVPEPAEPSEVALHAVPTGLGVNEPGAEPVELVVQVAAVVTNVRRAALQQQGELEVAATYLVGRPSWHLTARPGSCRDHAAIVPPAGAELALVGVRSGAEQGEGNDGDAVAAPVGLGTGGEDDRIEQVVAELLAEPPEVANISVVDSG